jgi:hypothetical protein
VQLEVVIIQSFPPRYSSRCQQTALAMGRGRIDVRISLSWNMPMHRARIHALPAVIENILSLDDQFMMARQLDSSPPLSQRQWPILKVYAWKSALSNDTSFSWPSRLPHMCVQAATLAHRRNRVMSCLGLVHTVKEACHVRGQRQLGTREPTTLQLHSLHDDVCLPLIDKHTSES